MLPVHFYSVAVAIAVVKAAKTTAGFPHDQLALSVGKKAKCTTNYMNLAVSASNTKILLTAPATNMAATELFVELTQVNSNVTTEASGGSNVIAGTYSIYSKLCIPADPVLASKVQTLQILTHGGTLDNTYWEISPANSYVDAAAAAGYATFSYDRLGSGFSDHPDPVQVVQIPLQVELLHLLVEKFRAGQIGSKSFKSVVGVGHSLGAGITQAVVAKYPKDFDALILQGTSTYFAYAQTGVASTGMQIANTDPSGRFAKLADGYYSLAPVPQALQFAFYRYPHYRIEVFNAQRATSQTNALGEMFTLGRAYAPAPEFTGPVDILNGENDYFYCGGDCKYPQNQAALVQPAFFPAASKGSQSYLVPNSGHNINAHDSAPQAFQQMVTFLQGNGLQ